MMRMRKRMICALLVACLCASAVAQYSSDQCSWRGRYCTVNSCFTHISPPFCTQGRCWCSVYNVTIHLVVFYCPAGVKPLEPLETSHVFDFFPSGRTCGNSMCWESCKQENPLTLSYYHNPDKIYPFHHILLKKMHGWHHRLRAGLI